jgi:hypothetical protein
MKKLKKKIKWEIFDKKPWNFSTRKRNYEKKESRSGFHGSRPIE